MTQPNRLPIPGLKPKDLVGIPWMVAFALRADGWWLRSDVIWSKPNAMPESISDRPTKAHEYLFLLTPSKHYFYDADAIREPHVDKREHKAGASAFRGQAQLKPRGTEESADRYYHPAGRNRRTVWHIPTQPFPEAHFATFPPALVEPCVLAGTSARGCCATCGAPLQRQVERWGTLDGERAESVPPMRNTSKAAPTGAQGVSHMRTGSASRTVGWQQSCGCEGGAVTPCTVLDPFSGSGTSGVVALGAGRSYVGVELNAAYREMSLRRLAGVAPLLARAAGGGGAE